MTPLSVQALSVTRRTRRILHNVSFRVSAGEFVGLIGANGAGKTTLMRAALGVIPAAGYSSLAVLDARERARQVAWMPQSRDIAWPVTVETLVALGRIPYLPAGIGLNPRDRLHIEDALSRMRLGPLRKRTITHLSGGEQARVLIARMLAQDTPLLLADEPIAGLDPAHQIATMQVFSNLAHEGHAVIASMHDLGLAARHCSRLILLGGGTIVADGTPIEVLSVDNLAQFFGVTAWFEQTPQGSIYQPLEVIQ